MSLYLLPHRGASLSTWSFGDGTPRFDLSGEYFIFYSHGLDVRSWTFWFEIQVFFKKKKLRCSCIIPRYWSLQDL